MREFAPLFALIAVVGLPTGSSAHADRLDTSIEKLFGSIVARTLEGTSGTDEDPLIAGWVRRVGEPIARVSPRDDLPARFTVTRSDVANAITAPGGSVFVTRGLLDTVESDDELAGVLAHETAHVAKRHAWQQLQNNALALLALGAIPNRSQTVNLSGIFANLLFTLHKSREMERQADEIGITFAAAAGYHPRGMEKFFDGLNPDAPRGIAAYFETHPSGKDRVKASGKAPWNAVGNADIAESVAAGLDARGLHEGAKRARAGRDPLAIPPRRFFPDPSLSSKRDELAARANTARKSIGVATKFGRVSSSLQQFLVINNQLGDLRWVILAGRAYALQSAINDVNARANRTLILAPGLYDSLSIPAGETGALDASIGRAEVSRAVEQLAGVSVPLKRASDAAALVLVELNNRFIRVGRVDPWVRFGALEGLVRYAESELSRADRSAAVAWRYLAVARLRHYRAELDRLAPESDPVARARWKDLLGRRLGKPVLATAGGAGDSSILAALACELSLDETTADSGRGSVEMIEWVVRSGGIPENIATILRLLVFDLRREGL